MKSETSCLVSFFFYCTKSDQEICYHQVQHADSRFLILILMHIIFLEKKEFLLFFFCPDHSVVENRREKSTASTKKLFLLSWCFEISFCETLQFSECVASFFLVSSMWKGQFFKEN